MIYSQDRMWMTFGSLGALHINRIGNSYQHSRWRRTSTNAGAGKALRGSGALAFSLISTQWGIARGELNLNLQPTIGSRFGHTNPIQQDWRCLI